MSQSASTHHGNRGDHEGDAFIVEERSMPGVARTKKTRILPLTTLSSLVISCLCIVSSVVTVYYSNGKAVRNWIPNGSAVDPSVLLAIVNSVLAISLKNVFFAGITIKWWRTYNSGTELANLHYVWNHGKGNGIGNMFKSFLTSPQARHVISVFAIVTITGFSDGPLLQRSLKTVIMHRVENYTSDTVLPTKITDGWAGTVDNASPARIFASNRLDEALVDWFNNYTVFGSWSCTGSCTGGLVGAGVVLNCSTGAATDIDLLSPQNSNATLFGISFDRTVDTAGAPVVEMTHEFTHNVNQSCQATIEKHHCTIRAATVEYEAILFGSVRLDPSRVPKLLSVYVSNGDLPTPNGTPAGPLSALDYFSHYYLRSIVTLGARTANESAAWEPVAGMLGQVFSEASEGKNSSCLFQWQNATDSIMHDIHDVMFRIAVYSSTGDETGYTRTWTDTYDELAYEADLRFLWLAVIIMLSGTVAATSLFWGYWKLDRQVTLSPLETGCALVGVLKNCGPPSSESKMVIEELLESIGDEKVEKLD